MVSTFDFMLFILQMGSGSSTKESSPDSTKDSHRPRSGSESLRSPVAKVMDIFRTRSQSVNASDDKRKVFEPRQYLSCYPYSKLNKYDRT